MSNNLNIKNNPTSTEKGFGSCGDNVDRCVCCGDVIPEGSMICWKCQKSTQTN